MTLAGGTPGAIWPLGGAMAKSAKKPEVRRGAGRRTAAMLASADPTSR
jgi:hypothetical protein